MAVQDLLLDPETLDEPIAYFDELREEAPVFFSARLQAHVITRYADARYVLENPQIFSSSTDHPNYLLANYDKQYFDIYDAAGTPAPLPTLVVTDGTVHQRYRRLVDATFNARSVRLLHPKIVALVSSLLDSIIDSSRVDFYSAFCLKLPIFVICDILGLPREDAPILKRGADAATRLAGSPLEMEETRRELHGEVAKLQIYLQRFIDRYRHEPADNLIGQLTRAMPEDRIPLSDQELLSILSNLNIGGNETTTNGLGNMFYRCFADPALQDRLRRERSLIPKFVEEILRLESPVASMPRFVTQDTVLGGVELKAGAFLLVSFAASNRDSAKFHCPAAIDTERQSARNHMAFGAGVHYCLGAMLARSELNIAMEQVLRRMSNIKIDNGGNQLMHERKMTVRALTSLPISFSALGADSEIPSFPVQ